MYEAVCAENRLPAEGGDEQQQQRRQRELDALGEGVSSAVSKAVPGTSSNPGVDCIRPVSFSWPAQPSVHLKIVNFLLFFSVAVPDDSSIYRHIGTHDRVSGMRC